MSRLLRRRHLSEFCRWAAPRVIHLGDPDQLAEADTSALAVLDSALAGKRLVYLGEADHYVRELAAFRLFCLRHLVDRGFGWVGEELGTCDGWRIDRYLDSGDQTWLSRLPSFGYRDDMRRDRDDTLKGPLAEGDYPEREMRAAHADVAVRLRKHAGPRRVHWFGLDADIAPGGSYTDLAQILGAGGPRANGLAASLERVPGEGISAEIERLHRLLTCFDQEQAALAGELGADAAAQVRRGLLALREGLAFVQAADVARGWPDLAPAMARREQAMIALARSVLGRMPERDRAVLLGHAAHLSRASRSLRLLDTGAGPAVDSLGTVLAHEYPGQVLSIWLLHGRGEDSQPLSSLPRRYGPVRGTLNEALAKLGDCFMLPLTGSEPLPALLRREQEIRWIYGAGCRTRISAQADAVVFIGQAHPLDPA